ncbi:MAG: hypothetical protein M3P30_11035 [Chloroflexota bacterium]|nr:hypothetical protein [Chloroflexota bacterium]
MAQERAIETAPATSVTSSSAQDITVDWPFHEKPEAVLAYRWPDSPEQVDDSHVAVWTYAAFQFAGTWVGVFNAKFADGKAYLAPTGELLVLGETFGDSNLQRLASLTLDRWSERIGRLTSATPTISESACLHVAAGETIGTYGVEPGDLEHSEGYTRFSNRLDELTYHWTLERSNFLNFDALDENLLSVFGRRPYKREDYRDIQDYYGQRFADCFGEPMRGPKNDTSVETACVVRAFGDLKDRFGEDAADYTGSYRAWVRKNSHDTFGTRALYVSEASYEAATGKSAFNNSDASNYLRGQLDVCTRGTSSS